VASCLVCGTELAEASRGRPPRYCSRACRSKAYRERVAERGHAPVEAAVLDIEHIVRAAIELADEQGPQALTMRGVAGHLGVGPMSLYRYVSGREELVDLIADAVFGESPLPETGVPAGWRDRLELSARQEWALYRAHPWLPRVAGLVSRPTSSPNVMAYTDWRMRAVDGHGLPFATLLQIAVLVSQFVQSTALSHDESAGQDGISRRDWLAARKDTHLRSFGSRPLPMVSRFDEAAIRATEPEPSFEFGLGRLLDGIGVLVDAHRAS
jgi:AcrR family transcriptional regulator